MNNALGVPRRQLKSVVGALSAALMVVSSIASGESVKKLLEVMPLNDPPALDIKKAQQRMDYSSVAGQYKGQLHLPDGQTFKEYLAECRSLIRSETIEQQARGEQCYKDKLQALIDPSKRHAEKRNPDKEN